MKAARTFTCQQFTVLTVWDIEGVLEKMGIRIQKFQLCFLSPKSQTPWNMVSIVNHEQQLLFHLRLEKYLRIMKHTGSVVSVANMTWLFYLVGKQKSYLLLHWEGNPLWVLPEGSAGCCRQTHKQNNWQTKKIVLLFSAKCGRYNTKNCKRINCFTHQKETPVLQPEASRELNQPWHKSLSHTVKTWCWIRESLLNSWMQNASVLAQLCVVFVLEIVGKHVVFVHQILSVFHEFQLKPTTCCQ